MRNYGWKTLAVNLAIVIALLTALFALGILSYFVDIAFKIATGARK